MPSRLKKPTPGQRWRARRNWVIYLAGQHGFPQRFLADVFDLPHSGIAAILKEQRTKHGDPIVTASSQAEEAPGGVTTPAAEQVPGGRSWRRSPPAA